MERIKSYCCSSKLDFFPKYSEELRTPINALLAQFIWCSLIILFIGSSFTITTFALFSTFATYSYWIFYFAIGIGLLIIRRDSDFIIRENPHLLETQNQNGNQFKVPLPLAGLYILAGLFILTFSFVVKSDNCQELEPQQCRIQNLNPIFIKLRIS
jgi:amino acid transporter